MSDNVASARTSTNAEEEEAPTAGVEVIKWSRDRVKKFLQEKRAKLDLENEDIDIIYNQRVKGDTFLDFKAVDFERWGIPGAPAKKLEKLIDQIKGKKKGKRTSFLPTPLIPNTYIILCFSFLLLIIKPALKTYSRYRRATKNH
jgi:hypothetical protein